MGKQKSPSSRPLGSDILECLTPCASMKVLERMGFGRDSCHSKFPVLEVCLAAPPERAVFAGDSRLGT
jgi:hypothetical protein